MSRGFESHKQGIKLPERSTKYSAGYDFFVPEAAVIPAQSKVLINTHVSAYMNDDEYLAIYVRSSLAIKKGLQLTNQVGIIDSDYYQNPDNGGVIFVSLTNTTASDVLLEQGEKFVQGIFQRYLTIDDDQVEKERTGGIGSTNQ